ncbi:MAG: outer membrane beta-barrel protein [Acidobacteriaceae bacterium]
MYTKIRLALRRDAYYRARRLLVFAGLLVAVLLLTHDSAFGQASSGTISGTATDTTGAVIPDAQVTLENTATHDKRITKSNQTGFFTFAAVPPANYKVTILSKGFEPWVGTDIIMHLGENHVLPHIVLPVASGQTSVEVVSSQAGVIPLDTGASTTTLNTTLVQALSIQGRDSAELVKFMPGMGMNTGLTQSEFNSQTTATNSGPIGAFSASGTQPYGGMQMTLDGASLVDVGNQGTQIANVNQDQTAEFTYLNAAFGADTPRGPTIIQITSKSGGHDFHGDVYTYLRNWQANANDAYLKAADPGASRPMDHQVYPGFTIGGPVLIPGTSFNRNHDKLFFFAGYEKMYQNPFPTLHQLVTPTAAMINGDFSQSSLPGAQTAGSSWWPTAQVPCANAPNWTSFCPSGGSQANPFPNGQIPASYIDPNGKALLTYLNKINPPNVDPATHNGYNFQYLDAPPVNRWELRLRGDYNPTDKDKLSLVYTKQNEADINNFGIWWDPGFASPLPSQLSATTLAKLWTANYVRVFNPSTTNEASFAYTYFTFPPSFVNPTAMTAAAAGFTNNNPFSNVSNSIDQLPNLISWGCNTGGSSGCFPGLYAPPMIKAFGNAYGNIKKIWSLQDNLTKVIGRHNLKAGIFWDENFQTQTTGYGNWTQGAIEFDQWSQYTTNNPLADMLIGHTGGESQAASAPVHDMAYHEWAVYGQDQWHMTTKLTLDYGVRFDHDGQWYPVNGPGLAVFDASKYDNTANAPVWTGMVWHQKDSSIPQSGFKSKLFYPDVRIGGAYDVHGDGHTVIRGGFGVYRWQFAEGDVDPALSPALNVESITTPSTTSFAQLGTYKPSASSWCALDSSGDTCPSGVEVIKKGDDKTPYTMNWDAMLDQVVPGNMVLEIQYIGNRTRNALLTGNGSNPGFYANINKIPLGGLYGTDALTGINYWQQSCAQGTCATPASQYYGGYRPYANYGVLNLIQHGSYSNYNGLVVALQKQAGRVTMLVNYTFSKVMGIRDGQTNNGNGDGASVDPFNLRNNYGPLNYDHTHIFNATYYIKLPGLHQANPLVKGVVNGWQLSGDTQVQSGAPLQGNTQGTLNATWQNVSNTYLLGSDAPTLMPLLTCDPRNGGGKYFNPKCFATPNVIGQNGPPVWPYIKGPAFFASDLGIFKTFAITERQNIQFRASAFNFLNHPLPQFGLTSDVNLHMSCNQAPGVTAGCNQGGYNTNTTTTGTPQYKTGHRIMEVALKYTF